MSSAPELKVLLVRPAYATRLTRAVRLVTEPLDLEYLSAVAAGQGCVCRIHDGMVSNEPFAGVLAAFAPDIVAITGYYPALTEMLALAAQAKAWRSATLVIAGGVHAELNAADFQADPVDVIVYAGGAHTFGQLLSRLRAARPVGDVPGTWQRSATGNWQRQPPAAFAGTPPTLPRPDRSHLASHRHAFTYLHYGPVALVKSADGCPYDCNFCYCRLLNGGRYTPRAIADVADEIAALDAPLIWLVDDTFLAEPGRAAALADALEQRRVRRRFIIYARATDVAGNPAVVRDLCRLGVIDVIVGLEAADEQRLEKYAKGCSVADNRRCVELLAAAGIACTGLFIVDPAATWSDFRKLNRWIAAAPLTAATVSIFTPFPGTPAWDEYQARLITRDCRHWDLCHLVLPPRLPRLVFWLLFVWANLRPLLRNPALARHVLRQVLRLPGGGA